MAVSREEIRRQLEESARVKQAFSDVLVERILQFAQKCAASLRGGGKVVFFGNGGSAAHALHLAAELVVKLHDDPRALAALGPPPNPSVPTRTGNHHRFQTIFLPPLQAPLSPPC